MLDFSPTGTSWKRLYSRPAVEIQQSLLVEYKLMTVQRGVL
jgi:hypothetical protein